MSGDPKTIKAARRMIERYGDDALRQVDQRIAELTQMDTDNPEVLKLWCQVREAIVALHETPTGDPPH